MKKGNRLKGMLFCMSAVLLTACGNNESIMGKWTQPVQGMPDITQGFLLEEGGKAMSVNMATLAYETWSQQDSLLILSGNSIGNRQTISFSDTFNIDKLTKDSLVLRKGKLVLGYARNVTPQEESRDTIPAALIVPAKKSLNVIGELIIGPEVRSFKPEGSSEIYWIIDKTGELYLEYDKKTGGTKNGQPVQADLQIVDMGKSDEGFVANYKGVYHVYQINRLY